MQVWSFPQLLYENKLTNKAAAAAAAAQKNEGNAASQLCNVVLQGDGKPMTAVDLRQVFPPGMSYSIQSETVMKTHIAHLKWADNKAEEIITVMQQIITAQNSSWQVR